MPWWTLLVVAVVVGLLGLVVGAAGGAGTNADLEDELADARDELEAAENRIDTLERQADETGDEEPESGEGAEELEEEEEESEPAPTTTLAAPLGARDNPIPVGQTTRVGEWDVTVTGANRVADGLVAAENMFNDPPAPGHQYFMVSVSAAYVGADASSSVGIDLTFEALGASNVAYDYDDGCGVIPQSLDTLTDVYQGGSISGNLCWSVTPDDAATLALLVEPSFSFSSEPSFFQIP